MEEHNITDVEGNKLMESRKAKNRRMKKIIGVLLLISIAYFIFTNFSLGDWPKAGFAVKTSSEECVAMTGPGVVTETTEEQLAAVDTGFKVMVNEKKAILTVRNNDNMSGEVRVIVYCVNGDEQGEQKKRIDAGKTVSFNFLDVDDCDLDYYMDPGMITRKVNKTVQVEDSVCD